ncbi:MAG: TetR/AcrR family transcriptional regulator [Saprospiraceae bacterium]|nr:TetR/AcrR family transcriptional regulator [Saprospiraceae bacterium]
MPLTTKQKIIESAIKLFNESGVANVRLQQIADDTGISVGNLAYHFKNKEAIVSAVYDCLFEEFSGILAHFLLEPGLADFDRQLELYHGFFSRYTFFLPDLFEAERSYPQGMTRWQQFVSKMLMQIRKRIEFAVQRKTLIPEPVPGIYNTLAHNLWNTVVFWMPQQLFKGESTDLNRFKTVVWQQISPYFTQNGWEEYSLEIQPIDTIN